MNLKKKPIGITIYFVILCMFCIYYPSSLDAREAMVYLTSVLSYIICGGVFLVLSIRFKIDILEPITMITGLYFFMFHFAPIYNLINGSSDVWGYDVLDGGVIGNIIFTISYLCFVFAYYSKNKKTLKKDNTIKCISNKQKLKNAVVIYVVCYGIFMINCISSGMSLSFFFSLGRISNNQEFNVFSAGGAFAVLNNLVYALLPSCLYIMALTKKKWIKILIFFLTFIPIYLRGFRYLMIAMVLMPITYYYLSHNKRPKIKNVLIALLIALFGITYVEITRVGISMGGGIREVDWSEFNFSRLWQSAQGNFDLYKSFYGAIIAFPKKVSYFWGEEMILATIYTMIPRVLWSSKPTTPFVRTLSDSVGYQASISGWAAPNIYEYYIDFGILGCFVCMAIFGLYWKKMKRLYTNENATKDDIIKYSCFYPLAFQLVIRGYTPMNFYTLLFMWLAIKFITKVTY